MNLLPRKKYIPSGISSLIGDTPLIRLSKLFPNHEVYGKMEMMNPAGSIKDRTSQFIIEESLKCGHINQDTIVIESTSGNMGVGLAQICLYHGLKLILIVDPYINAQTLQLLKAYGATIEMVDQPDDSGSYLKSRIERVQELMAENENSFWTQQYENPLNPLTHHRTVKEIKQQLGTDPDYIMVATSTCGTLMGFADYCFQYLPKTKVVPVDSYGSIIFGGKAAKRWIPGFGASKTSTFVNRDLLEEPVIVKEWESITGCKKLLQSEAILAGGSTGALVSAVEMNIAKFKHDTKIVIIVCDRGERYLDTIYSEKWIKTNFGKKVLKQINKAVKDDLVEEVFC